MFGWFIIAMLIILVLAVLIRTLNFKPLPEAKVTSENIEFDGDRSVQTLAELIQCKTVSYYDHSLEDDKEFEKLYSALPKLFPNVYACCEKIEISNRALLFKWEGKSDAEASVLMAHFDVVPVEEENWEKPAFSAVIEDGVMWGRGTIDTKVTFNAVLSAADNLITQGFKPENDIYFAFSGGEEVDGPGAKLIVDYLTANNVKLSMVLDEGGAVVEDVFPGVHQPCALIGVAEKGRMNVEYTIESEGGHASAPKPHTPVGRLSAACTKLENHPFKAHFTGPAMSMLDTLGRYSTFLYRMIFANLWLFKCILDIVCRKSGGELNALIRTTVAFTQMEGSSAPNVIPPSAKMVSNIRLAPGDTIESGLAYIKSVIKDDDIKLSIFNYGNPTTVSSTQCEGWSRIINAVKSTWKETIVSPYIMVQCSDSANYSEVSDKVYRFCGIDMTAEERHSIHGNNEKIRVEAIKRCVEFYIRLIKQC